MARKTSIRMDKRQVQRILPQRPPFLFIDGVVSADQKAGRITCCKKISAKEGYFKGHFPGKPIMPGVLITEAMAQAGIVLYAVLKPKFAARKPDYLLGKVDVSFKHPVFPGDKLVIEVEKDKLLDTAGMVKAKAKVKGKEVASATLSFGVRFKHA